MEEAEALATNVAIMGTRMLAKGTLSSLQERYGGQLSVRAVRAEGFLSQEVEGLIRDMFEGRVSRYFDVNGQVGFQLPNQKGELGAIMRVMEELKGNDVGEEMVAAGSAGRAGGSSRAKGHVMRVLKDYTITGPTLEEVFMNVAKESGTAGAV
jgi:hypothetical protein